MNSLTTVKTFILLFACLSFAFPGTAQNTPGPALQGEQLDKKFEEDLKKYSAFLSSENPITSLADRKNIVEKLPQKCIAHLEEEKLKLVNGEYSKETWYQHAFECSECCGPMLTGMMKYHIEKVSISPHFAVFFDFAKHEPSLKFQQEMDKFVAHNFRPNENDKILLIGRASRKGGKGFNRELSGKRVAQVKRRLLKLGVQDAEIHSVYFGHEPPQLDLDIANNYYKIPSTSYTSVSFHGQDYEGLMRLNQSVMIIIYNKYQLESFEHSAK